LLLIHSRSADISANVAALSVASGQPVDPPHDTAEEWRTAAWVVEAAYPAVPSSGTTYIYGHACHHHVCSFTELKDSRVGDTMVVTTPAGVLTYRIDRIGTSPKDAASLPGWASDSTVKDRLVLVTCEFEQGDVSTTNLIVSARRVA
jgi:LPXTG-site transpeptidase (sortase) family protein